jgi:hypothetical protein
MQTYFLEFEDREQMMGALPVFKLDEIDPVIDYSHPDMLNVIGLFYEATGEKYTDDDGVEHDKLMGYQGWQLNYVGELPAELNTLKVDFIDSPTYGGRELSREPLPEIIDYTVDPALDKE